MLNKNLKATQDVMELIYQRDNLVHIWLFCVDNEVELHLLGQVMN